MIQIKQGSLLDAEETIIAHQVNCFGVAGGLAYPELRSMVVECLNYGRLRGLGQWRNSGKGRYLWQELDDGGSVIGGNLT